MNNMYKKKSLYTQDDDSSLEDKVVQSFDEDRVKGSTKEFMLMVLGTREEEHAKFNDEVYKVYLEGELMSAFEKNHKLRKNNKMQKEMLTNFEK